MDNEFKEPIFNEMKFTPNGSRSKLIKCQNADFEGKVKISIDDEDGDGIKVILRKDENENIREIKFVCSCGQTKSLILDYSEQ
ncbi:MAG: hypothetical protein Q8N03_02600 [Ignavibacteria bacterium]|jgi:hypothetical protein|nr:hypothetical protein [Ignavibacteria bacterium]